MRLTPLLQTCFATLIILFSLETLGSEIVHRDKNGMPRCIEGAESVLVIWDPLIQNSSRPVFGISLKEYAQQNHHYLKECKDWPYAKPWPEGIQLISKFSEHYSKSLQFALQQIAEGGQTLRSEVTGKAFIANHSELFTPRKAVDFVELESSFGPKFSATVAEAWISELTSKKKLDPRNCEALIGTCDYYLCVEANQKCGLQGYPMHFGYKFCNRSVNKLHERMKSPFAKKWVLDTVQCLQVKLNEILHQESLSCSGLLKKALDSHPECYVDTGFCEVPFTDKAQILTIVEGQIFREGSLSLARKTVGPCLSR